MAGNTYAVQAQNDGTLTPVATLELDFEGFAGLDISGATGHAYAILNVNGAQSLYRIGASKGKLTRLEADVSSLADLTIVTP